MKELLIKMNETVNLIGPEYFYSISVNLHVISLQGEKNRTLSKKLLKMGFKPTGQHQKFDFYEKNGVEICLT